MTAPVPRHRSAAPLLLIGDAFEFSKTTPLRLGVLGGVLHPFQGVVLQGDAASSILGVGIPEITEKLMQNWVKRP